VTLEPRVTQIDEHFAAVKAGMWPPYGSSHRASITQWLLMPLRLIVGFGFIQHGFPERPKEPDAFGLILHGIGVPEPDFMAWITIVDLLYLACLIRLVIGGSGPLSADDCTWRRIKDRGSKTLASVQAQSLTRADFTV
jgi:hypothetical protein